MSELIPLFPGRPPILKVNTQVVFVSVHDGEYLRTKRIYKQNFRLLNLEGKDIRRLIRKYASWKLRERKWYWRLGIMPPDYTGPPKPPEGWLWERAKPKPINPVFAHEESCFWFRKGRSYSGGPRPRCTCEGWKHKTRRR